MRERVALSTTSGMHRFLFDSEEYLRQRISRDASGIIKGDYALSPGSGDGAGVNSALAVQHRPWVRSMYFRPDRPIRICNADGAHISPPLSQLGSDP